MQHKQRVKVLYITLFLILSSHAHADFRKAIDAYIARDGNTMLKEVKHAVDTKNDDGLMLFLMATNMDAATSDYDVHTKRSKSTLRAILPEEKWDEMRTLLIRAAENSSADAQYYLNIKSHFGNFYNQKVNVGNIHTNYVEAIKKYALYGSYEAIYHPYSDTTILAKAKAGDAFYQLLTALQYHGYMGDYGCDIQSLKNVNSLCSKKDAEKGDYWLERAVLSYEASVHHDINVLYKAMCDFSKETKGIKNDNTVRWCALAQLNQNQTIYLPDLVKKAKSELTREDKPIIKASFKDGSPDYELEVYKDGRVLIVYDSNVTAYKDTLYVLDAPTKEINKFIHELKKLRVLTWDTTSQFYGFPQDCNGQFTEMQIQINNQQQLQRHHINTCYPNALRKHFRLVQIAKLKALVEKHFDVNRYRFKLGNSKEKTNSKLSRQQQWNALSKMKVEK